MKTVMEKQLSWFAIVMTAFYSLLASCRAEEHCGHEQLVRCASTLEKFTKYNEFGFVSTKEELDELCPNLEAATQCIKRYILRCMDESQRQHFDSLFTGTNKAIMELCHDGAYQDEFLRHAPCMLKVKAEYELCSKKYLNEMHTINNSNHTAFGPNGPLKPICCSFQEYLQCSHHTVRRQCGEDTAEFTKGFLDRMSSSLIKMHCKAFTPEQCALKSSGSSSLQVGYLVPIVLVTIGRYFA